MSSPATEPPPPAPSARSRRRSAAFIAAFVGLQFLIPLTYLGREDSSDDRFTWKSLGADPPAECESHAVIERFGEEGERLPLQTLVHEDWVRYLEQGRRAVIDAFLLRQCETERAERVEVVTECADPRGRRVFSLRCGGERAYETTRTAAR